MDCSTLDPNHINNPEWADGESLPYMVTVRVSVVGTWLIHIGWRGYTQPGDTAGLYLAHNDERHLAVYLILGYSV